MALTVARKPYRSHVVWDGGGEGWGKVVVRLGWFVWLCWCVVCVVVFGWVLVT